ncbi:MAG: tetraacyldisaccharide 4'-kinase [Candidatus Omnitrophica bacterium]|nr:tetraacyldisaccharide 4'-kinase [Candidatus Omnitrophota bacterium]
MKMRNKETNIIEKGGNFYWYFWHSGNKDRKQALDNILFFFLKCLVPIYYAMFFLHRCIKRKNAPQKAPVISVGNLTLGGTGKTPCVEFLIKKFLEKKRRVGLLTKGYARENKDSKKIVFSQTKEDIAVKDIGDEPYLLSKHFPSIPIFISRHRAKSFLDAEKKRECDVFIMDDGFQYPHIDKDLEILLINKTNPFGNGFVFPAGFLREPINSIKRADLIILTHADECVISSDECENSKNVYSVLSQKAPRIPILESIHEPLYFQDYISDKKYQAEELLNKRFLSLASLADPLSFEESLKKLRLNPVKKVRFPDHYPYKSENIEWVSSLATKENIDFIITTEKDCVRFPKGPKFSIPVLYLIINFKIIKSEEVIDDMINKVLEKYKI